MIILFDVFISELYFLKADTGEILDKNPKSVNYLHFYRINR